MLQFIYNLAPTFSTINLISVVFLVYSSRNLWLVHFKRLDLKQWSVLIAIIFVSGVLRFVFFKPRHIMYVDEFWYMEAAKNLLSGFDISWYPKSIGWPVILRMIFSIFGVSNLAAIHASTIFGLLTLVNIFLLGSIIYKNNWLGISAAAIFTVLPGHLLWSVTAETNIVALYFVTLGMFLSILYFKYKTNSLLWVSLLCIGFCGQIRPENHIFYLVFLTGIFVFMRPLPKVSFWFVLPWALSVILSAPDILIVMRDKMSTNWLNAESGGAIVGANFSVNNFISNSLKWGAHLFGSSVHPYLFSALFIIGFIFCLKYFTKYWELLVVWFILLWVTYFSSWFQTLGGGTDLYAKSRFYLSFYPVLVILGVGGIYWLSKFISVSLLNKRSYQANIFRLLLLILIFNFVPYFIPHARDPYKELEIKVISQLQRFVSPDDIVLVNLPSVLKATTDIRTYPLDKFLGSNLSRKEVYSSARRVMFLEDCTCAIREYNFLSNCQRLITGYDIKPVRLFTIKGGTLSKTGYSCIGLYEVGPAKEERAL